MSKFISGFISSLCLMLTSQTFAQNLDIQPLNDNNSLRTYIAIPFATKAASNTISLREVRIRQNSNCRTLIDPYIVSNFFVKCTTPGPVTLDIVYLNNGVVHSTEYGPFTVLNISETGTVIDDGDSGPSEEWRLGQTLWNSTKGISGRQSCAFCHGSPGTKAHSISLSSLNAALAAPYMSTAIPLTESEKQALITFVRSYR